MEEGHVLPLSAGGCYAMARTDTGFLAAARTRDATAATGWSATTLARYYTPLDALVPLEDVPLNSSAAHAPTIYRSALKSSRGPFTPKRHPSGVPLLLFYNTHGTQRNPYFISAAVEDPHGELLWGQPELALFDPSYRDTARTRRPPAQRHPMRTRTRRPPAHCPAAHWPRAPCPRAH
jgi:hypothetical protein